MGGGGTRLSDFNREAQPNWVKFSGEFVVSISSLFVLHIQCKRSIVT